MQRLEFRDDPVEPPVNVNQYGAQIGFALLTVMDAHKGRSRLYDRLRAE